MKRALRRHDSAVYHIIDGSRVDGPPPGVWGNLSGVRGNLSGVRGDLSDVLGDLSGAWGDLSGVTGDLSGVTGDLSGVTGNVDKCGLTEEDRARGVDVADLICEDPAETPGT